MFLIIIHLVPIIYIISDQCHSKILSVNIVSAINTNNNNNNDNNNNNNNNDNNQNTNMNEVMSMNTGREFHSQLISRKTYVTYNKNIVVKFFSIK